MSYPKDKLGNYIDVLSGYAFKSKDFSETGVPVIKIKNIAPPCVTLEDLSYVPQSIAFQNQRYVLQKGDVLIAMTGSHINQIASVVGRVGRVRYDEVTVLNQRVGKIINKDNNISDLVFVYYYLCQYDVKVELAQKAGGAANQANISPSDIKELSFPCPSIETQHCIAAILSRYDSLIENYQKQIKLLEEAAQRLYKEWFVDLHFPGHENTKIVDGVPEGWEKGRLEDIAFESGKKVDKKSREDYEYYMPIDSLPKHSLTYLSPADISMAESSLVSFKEGDVIFGAMRPYFHKVCFAQSSGLTRSTCFVLNAKVQEYQGYLLMLMFDENTVKHATSISVGTTMPYTRWKEFKSMQILIPSKDLATIFGEQISLTTKRLKKLSTQIRLLTEARDRLLPKLMSGEIAV